MLRSLFLSMPLFSLLACSYSPEEPGQCKLQCSNAIIMGNEPVFSIKLKTTIPANSCGPTQVGNAVEGLRADFLIGESILDQAAVEVAVRPVPNISVEPVIIGITAPVENGETNPSCKGVKTPRDNWCSDACGVASLQVVGVCPAAGTTSDVTIQLHSGAVYSDAAVFPISTRSPDTM